MDANTLLYHHHLGKVLPCHSLFADGQFKCPDDKSNQYPDKTQCDKFYVCDDGVSTTKYCPDGLVFDPSNKQINKCDQPFNVDCGDRHELRKCFLHEPLLSYSILVRV